MKNLIQRFICEEEGQDLIEYAMLIVFIALVVILVLPGLGGVLGGVYERIGASLFVGS